MYVQIFVTHPTIRLPRHVSKRIPLSACHIMHRNASHHLLATTCIVMAHPHTASLSGSSPQHHHHCHIAAGLPEPSPVNHQANRLAPVRPPPAPSSCPPPSAAQYKVMWSPFLVGSPCWLTSHSLTDCEVAWPHMPLHSHLLTCAV